MNALDSDVLAISAFPSFADLMGTSPNYHPTIRADLYGDAAFRVARAFDDEAKRIGQERRSYVYYTGRDGQVRTCFGLPIRALHGLLERVLDDEDLSARERVMLRELVAGVNFNPAQMARIREDAHKFRGPKGGHDVIDSAVGLLWVRDTLVAITVRGTIKTFTKTYYSASHARRTGSPGRLDIGSLKV